MSVHEDIPEQSEDIPGRPIGWAIVATILTIAVCVIVVWGLQHGIRGGGRTDMENLSLRPPAQPFEDKTVLELQRAAQLRELDGWKWVDNTHERVLVPANVAIDRYLQQRGAR
ncbi:MAG: hypothetical protein JWO36_4373 [Myxococcales bacterium]|nr:hypothetical protein [Myxococcales bacterium]